MCLSVCPSARLPCCLSVCILVCLSVRLYVYLPVFLSHSHLFCHLPPCLILFYFAFHFQAENYGNFLVRFGPADKAACARLDVPDPPAAAVAAAHRKSERDRRRRDKPLGHKGSPARGQWQFLSNCDSLESWRTAPDSAIATPSAQLSSRLSIHGFSCPDICHNWQQQQQQQMPGPVHYTTINNKCKLQNN